MKVTIRRVGGYNPRLGKLNPPDLTLPLSDADVVTLATMLRDQTGLTPTQERMRLAVIARADELVSATVARVVATAIQAAAAAVKPRGKR